MIWGLSRDSGLFLGIQGLFRGFRAFCRFKALFGASGPFWGFGAFSGIQGLFQGFRAFSQIRGLFVDSWPFHRFAAFSWIRRFTADKGSEGSERVTWRNFRYLIFLYLFSRETINDLQIC